MVGDVKELIEFLKENKVKKFKNETVELEFSELSFISEAIEEKPRHTGYEDTDEDLYYSSK